ncbi:MAG: hypothetical protein HC837_17885 [Chloroflexaceae bacterium]|nr:hypothetical protein [Chloroflexaceae bacterium]
MRFVTFTLSDMPPRAGALVGNTVVDLAAAAPLVFEDEDLADLDWDMLGLLRSDQDANSLVAAETIVQMVLDVAGGAFQDEPPPAHNGQHDQGPSGCSLLAVFRCCCR